MNHELNNQRTPPCTHFSKCGGCSLQHLSKQSYDDLKQNILEKIIIALGVPSSVIAPMIAVGTKSRRRAEFKIAINKGNVRIGFFAKKSHDVIELTECPVSEDKLTAILPALKTCIQSMKKPGMLTAISLTVLENGLDAIVMLRGTLNSKDRESLINFAKENNIIRLSEQIESEQASWLYDNGKAHITFADIDVSLPIGAFLQASSAGQIAITNLVTKHLKGCQNIADLYSGCGTYSFPLIRQTKYVSAFEGSEDMVNAMHNSIAKNNLDGNMTARTRNLFKQPIKTSELNRFDGIVINPPRNGALPQIKNISKSSTRKIVMVSCNPVTFQRDAKQLIDNGYKVTMAVPIDQFLWSNHLEIVAFFEK